MSTVAGEIGEDTELNSRERDIRLLRLLANMPFLDRIELSHVSGEANQRVYEELADLQEIGVVDCVAHGSPLLAPTRRFYLTSKGVEWLADIEGMSVPDALRRYPVSRRWQRILLERLDAVGAVYRVAANLALACGGPVRLEWYRSRALDAALRLPGGKTLGVVRQGATSDRTGFSKRAWRLREEPGPETLLVLTPDEVRFRHTSRMMAEFRGMAFVALEAHAVQSWAEDKVWQVPSGRSVLNLSEVLKYGAWRGTTSKEEPLAEAKLPERIVVPQNGLDGPDHLLPVMLKPGEKRVLDLVANWPWITTRELESLLGVSKMRVSQLLGRLIEGDLVSRVAEGRRRRLGLTD